MSDSFADLWSSSAPLPPKPKPQTLASSTAFSNQPQRSTNSSKSDLFSLLASSGPNQQRYGSPNSAMRGTERRSNAGTPSPAPPVSIASSSSRGGGDAFGDLFASSSSSAAAGGSPASMTIAARMAMEAQQKSSADRSGSLLPQKTNVPAHDSAWAKLDSLVAARDGFGGIQPPIQATTSRKVDLDDDWGLGDFGSSTVPNTTSSKSIPQPQPRPGKSSSKTTTVSPWDPDEFATPSPHLSRPSPLLKTDRQKDHFDSPDADFDFGNREDLPPEPHTRGALLDFDGVVDDDFGPREGLLDSFGNDSPVDGIGRTRDDDDILGMLSKPVEVVKAQTQPFPSTLSHEASPNNVAPLGNRKPKSIVKSSSPPPHIIGQIVEMGFDVDQARKALAKSKDGVDVQAALELLLGGSVVPDNRNGPSRSRIEEHEDHIPARTRGTPKGFKERERERIERVHRERERESSTPPSTDALDMQDHADRLISQASEIGLSVLTKASAFWKEGKERVAKAYEERAAGVVQKDRGDGKPKWMEGPTFRDGDDERGRKDNLKDKQKVQQEPEEHVHLQEKYVEQRPGVGLFEDEPIRARQPKQRLAASRTSTPPSRPTATVPSPPITRERPLPKALAPILSTVNKHRTAGTSQFKLGQYASAVESYSAAISSLPQGHLLLVPLLNNRAIARMRTGEYKGASEDAGRALKVIMIIDDGPGGLDGFDPNANSPVQITLSSWNPSVEPSFVLTAAQQKENDGGWTHLQGLGVDLVDGYVKALRRRAEANEGRERWTEALKDWEVLGAGDAGWVKEHVRKEAHRGAARCRKMMNGGSEAGGISSPASKPKPKPPITRPKPVQAVPAAPSTALRSLQATTAQAEADENLKFQLKDAVDAKLSAWRGGKETNIRALLASLDMVLWEEILRGVKVGGLHELVTQIQVKKGYMKAIGRVHPDKLNAQNSTVEQRMLANGVFGTLNEAWIAFQNSNGM